MGSQGDFLKKMIRIRTALVATARHVPMLIGVTMRDTPSQHFDHRSMPRRSR